MNLKQPQSIEYKNIETKMINLLLSNIHYQTYQVKFIVENIGSMRGYKKKEKKIKEKPKLLDKLTTPFDCSGTFELKQSAKIFYSSEQYNGVIKFPAPDPSEIETALKFAKKSGFGKGQENIVDEEYRLAFQYLPDSLGISSQLSEAISQEISEAIGHKIGKKERIRAQLIKLNIYPKGGKFQSHVDSPKGKAFGSLVVFLPSYFEGGDLIIQHNEDRHTFSFGEGSLQSVYVNWVAFYNDCVHSITEVTNGYRLTLSYNLFYPEQQKVQVFPSEEMVSNLSTLENGKLYGYYCEHYYGNNALKGMKEGEQMSILKGKDYDLFICARSMGIPNIQVKVLYKVENRYSQENQIKNFTGPPSRISKIKLGEVFDEGYYYQERQNPFEWIISNLQASQFDLSDIEWINTAKDPSKYTYAINGYYGNDYSMGESYCQLIIILST